MSKQPSLRVTLDVTRDSGVETLQCSTRPFADETFTEGRVTAWAPIRRELSDDQGQPRMVSSGVTLNDDDGAVRGALAEDETRFVRSTDARLEILSEAGRRAGLDWRLLMRGTVDKPQVTIARKGQTRSRQVQMDLIDALGPFYDQTIPHHTFLRSDFPDIHRDLEGTPIPLIGGEHSDAGAEDVNGNSAEKGLIPAIYVGGRQTVNDDPTSGTPSFLAPPASVAAVVIGTTGATSRFYGVTALSDVGETILGDIATVTNSPATLSSDDAITVTWAAVPDATGYIVYGRDNATPVRRLQILEPGETSYTDTGIDTEHAPAPPATNRAQVPLEDGGFFWDFYVICLGPAEITGIYGSDLAEGVAPKRVLLNDTAGVDVLVPGMDGWPHDAPYVELGSGLRVTGFYARGPRSQQHIDGVVTFAVSTCGYEDVGDGSGAPITQAFPMLQHFLTQFVPDRDGDTYESGLWKDVPTFADGTPMYQTSKFAACQALTQTWLGNADGYLAHIYIREPMTVRAFLTTFFQTFDAFGATNHHGQFYPVLYNTGAAVGDGVLYRERIEIARLENPVLDTEHVEPSIAFQYDYDPDLKKFRSEVETIADAPAVAAQKAQTRDRGTKSLRYTRDAVTARDAMSRRVQRLKLPRWRQPIVVKYAPALTNEPGDQIRIDHPDGATATGWDERPFLLTGHTVDPSAGEVTLMAYDVQPLLTLYQANNFGAGATMPFAMTGRA